VIRLEGVSFAPGGKTVLDQVALTVNAGEVVVVQGSRAAGKSALLRIAAARLVPDAGAVWISSRNVGDLQRSSLPLVRRNIAYLPAAAPLVEEDSALENVMLALAVRGWEVAASEAGALRALFVLGLDDRRNTPARVLSAGERQLVALARALAGSPPLMVLDEPTAGLGGDDRERVLAALTTARDEGVAVLAASSDEAFVQAALQRSARRVRLEAGRLSGGLPGIALVPRPAPMPVETTSMYHQGRRVS
jgi:putative ABC transport system ATP-binding protein